MKKTTASISHYTTPVTLSGTALYGLKSESESECVLKPPSDGYSGLEDYSLLYVRLPKR